MREEKPTVQYEVKLFKEIVKEIPGSPIVSAAKELNGFVSNIKDKMQTDIELLKEKLREYEGEEEKTNSESHSRNLNKLL